MAIDAALFSSASDEWTTPQDLFDELDLEFQFVLDAAAQTANRKTADYFGPGHKDPQKRDALAAPWGADGAVWLNPPYSSCREFVAKAAAEARPEMPVVCLVPSRTDTRWWHDYIWDRSTHSYRPGVAVRFVKGRLKFSHSANSAPFPSVLVIFSGETTRAHAALHTREPETSVESQTYIDSGEKPIVCYVVTAEAQSHLGYRDTAILGVCATDALAQALIGARTADALGAGLRVWGHEKPEWGDDDWEVDYCVTACTLEVR